MKERNEIHILSNMQHTLKETHKSYLDSDPKNSDVRHLRYLMNKNRKKLAKLNKRLKKIKTP